MITPRFARRVAFPAAAEPRRPPERNEGSARCGACRAAHVGGAAPLGALSLLLATALTLTLAALSPLPLAAQGFLFGHPKGAVALRGGMTFPRATGGVFDFTTQHLTVDRHDFNAITGELDVSFRLSPRFEAVLGAGVSRTSVPSEDRLYEDQNNLPIRQTTTLTSVPVTAGIKAYLVPTGRSIGRLAWVPSRVAPYVGAGVGLLWYRFQQRGDFVDYTDLSIFSSRLLSSGVGPMGAFFAGVDVGITPSLALTGEARYILSSANMNADFADLDRIDMNGLQTTVGLAVRF